MLVLAGPGSGKTSVLISRLQQLTTVHKIPPQEILVVTFTRAAAKEMKDRYMKVCGLSSSPVTFGTLHGIFFAVLRETKKTASKRLLAGEEKRRLLYTLLERLGQEPAVRQEQAIQLEKEFSAVRHRPDRLKHFVSEALEQEQFMQAVMAYQTALQQMNAMDFDDLAGEVQKLFLTEPEVCRQWQKRFSHILVDEFQDIDADQYEILKLLAKPQDNLFMVGDDDQSIYGFRGADPKVMQRVPEDFPALQMVVLDTNYRCGKRIIDCAGQLIDHNTVRYEKKAHAAKTEPGTVEYLSASSKCRQWQMLADDILKEVKQGREPKQIAVLTRTGKGGQGIRMLLQSRGISCQGNGSEKRLSDHFIWKDILAYLHIGAGYNDRRFYLKILNKPMRYLPRTCLCEPETDLKRLAEQEDTMTAKGLLQLHRELSQLQNLVPATALYCIRKHIGYESYLNGLAEKRGQDVAEYLAVLEVLQQLAAGQRSLSAFIARVEQFSWKYDEGGVQISTLHGSKGLEYEAVYIPDLNEGNIPWKEAKSEMAVEEERRLLYVGMTRAKEKLVLSFVEEREKKNRGPSRFLYETDMSV